MENRFGLAILGCVLLASGGCGLTDQQKLATANFADAATNFGTSTSEELAKMRDQTVVMNIAMYRVPDLPPTYLEPGKQPAAEESISQGDYKNLAGDFSGAWYDQFLLGPQAMKAYGTALNDLLKADNKAEVNKSSNAVAAALAAVPGSPAGNASSAVVSATASQLTEWLLEKMKAHAVRNAVVQYQGAVKTICGQVEQNFTPKEDKTFAFRFENTARNLFLSSETALKYNSRKPQARADSLNAYLLAQQNLDEVDRVFPTIRKSSVACVTADTTLAAELEHATYDITDIENFVDAVQTAKTNISVLSQSK